MKVATHAMTRTALRALLIAAVGAMLIFPLEAHDRALEAQVPTALPMPSGTNVLLGRVVEAGTDAPVGGAIVTLYGQVDAAGRPISQTVLPPSVNVMTTADGYFVVRNLRAGFFAAGARAYGYLDDVFLANHVVEIRDSQKPTEVLLRVWKHATIGGRVVDERGEPVTGLPVSALRRVSAGGRVLMRQVETSLTDDRGVYRISQLTPGDYTAGVLSTTTTLPASVAGALDPSADNRTTYRAMMSDLRQSGFWRAYGCPTCISTSHEGHHVRGLVLQRPGVTLPPAPDGGPLAFANTFYPGTSRPQDAAMVSLESGEARTDLDLVVRLMPTVTVAGMLEGPDGPIKHAQLTLSAPGSDFQLTDVPGVATAITDDLGAFTFLAVTSGEYRLSGSVELDYNRLTGEGRTLWAAQSLSVGDTTITGLTVAMRPGVRMSGIMEFRTSAGVASKPSQLLTISMLPVREQSGRSLPAFVQPDGTFRSPGSPPGRYTLLAFEPAGWFWHTTTIAGRPVPHDTIELESSDMSGLVLTLKQTTNRVSGRVTGAGGAPDLDAAVIVFPADPAAWRDTFIYARRLRRVRAKSAGAYEIAALAPGDYYLAAVSTRLALNWEDPAFLERLIPGATRLTLGAEDEKTIPLRTITLSGR